nr:TonB-dependent receptor Fiu [Klebsiella pneumoniae]
MAANDDGTGRSTAKARGGYELSATGNLTPDWTIIAGYTQQHATVTEGQNVAQDGSSALAYTPKHAFTLWTQYQATSDLSVGGGVRYVGSLRRGSDGAVGTRITPRATGLPTPNWAIGSTATSICSSICITCLIPITWPPSTRAAIAIIRANPDLYADGERPFLSLRVGPLRPTFRENTAMMYHIPDVLSTDRWRNLPGSWRRPSGSTGGLRWVAGAAVKQNQQIDTRTPLYARLQAAVLDMLRGHPQFFPPRCRGRFPRRCLTAMGRGDLWFSRRWRRSPERRGGLDAH